MCICDPKSRVLQIQGPASIDIMKKASNGKIDENFKYYRCGFFDLGGQNLFVSRTALLMNLVLKFILKDLRQTIWHFGII